VEGSVATILTGELRPLSDVTHRDVARAMLSMAVTQTPFPSDNADVVPALLLMTVISFGE
jgi:hypothetical protein